jgi:hypothetical protein
LLFDTAFQLNQYQKKKHEKPETELCEEAPAFSCFFFWYFMDRTKCSKANVKKRLAKGGKLW